LNDADCDLVWPIGPIFQNWVDVPRHTRVPCNREAIKRPIVRERTVNGIPNEI
jgi:hypothetical protein